MIVKTKYPDYLMHYGVSIKDGAPGVGTGNWRRGGSGGGNPITKAIARFKTNLDDARRKKQELRVSKIVNYSRQQAQAKASNLAKALLNVDKNSPARKEVDELINIGRKLNALDDEKDDLLMKYLENEEQVEKDAEKEAEEANNSEDSYGNDWTADDFSDTDYAAGVMFDKYEAKRNPKLIEVNDKIRENENNFKKQLIEAISSNTINLKKELNSFRAGETGTKEFDRMLLAVTLGQIKKDEERRVKESEDIVNKYTNSNNKPSKPIPINEVQSTAKYLADDIKKHKITNKDVYYELINDYATKLKYQGNYNESLSEIEDMIGEMVDVEMRK